MNRNERESRFLEKVRSQLDRETQDLDARTAARRRGIRHAALAQPEPGPHKGWRFLRLPVAAVTTGVIIAVAATMTFKPTKTLEDAQVLTDRDILVAEDNLGSVASV